MRHEDVSVLQVCDEDQVIVGNHVGDQVVSWYCRETCLLYQVLEKVLEASSAISKVFKEVTRKVPGKRWYLEADCKGEKATC